MCDNKIDERPKVCMECIFFDYSFNGTHMICTHGYTTKMNIITGATKIDWDDVSRVRRNEDLCGERGRWWTPIPLGFNEPHPKYNDLYIHKMPHEERERLREEAKQKIASQNEAI